MAADRATVALEEFMAAIKKLATKQITFGTKTINKAIGALTELLSPNQTTTTKNTAVVPRVETSQNHQARPMVNNSQQSGCIFQPKRKEILQKYTRGTTEYKVFDNKTYQGYICDYDKTNGYYKLIFEDGDNVEYNHKEIAMMLHKLDKSNLLQELVATRFVCVKAQYAKTQTSYHEPSKFRWIGKENLTH